MTNGGPICRPDRRKASTRSTANTGRGSGLAGKTGREDGPQVTAIEKPAFDATVRRREGRRRPAALCGGTSPGWAPPTGNSGNPRSRR